MAKTRQMLKDFQSESIKSDKKNGKKNQNKKKSISADKVPPKVQKNTSIQDLLNLCRPVTVLLPRCKEIQEIYAKKGKKNIF